ncbi:MAG: hypothetical protein II950_02895 [Prevotella sp.]|nr:hypothetical protein [Prevotella sp.]
MSKRFLTLIFSYVLFFASCGLPYANKIKLSESDLEWIPYQSGDTVLFTCGESVDTMILSEIIINNPKNEFPFDTEGVNWLEGSHDYKGNAGCEYVLYHGGEVFEGILFVLRKEHAETSAILEISFAGNYSDSKSIDSTFLYKEEKLECLLFNFSDMHKGKHQYTLPINRVIWSKKNGLYEYSLGKDSIYSYETKK